MQTIRKHGYARAGLIGNPSDGYHGKTIAFLIRDFCATGGALRMGGSRAPLEPGGPLPLRLHRELAQDVDLFGYYGGIRLLKATVKKFLRLLCGQAAEGKNEFQLHDRKFSIRYESNIPRAVGLAGSSAIIVATLQALMEFYDIDIPRRSSHRWHSLWKRKSSALRRGCRIVSSRSMADSSTWTSSRKATQTIDGFACGTYEPLDPSSVAAALRRLLHRRAANRPKSPISH